MKRVQVIGMSGSGKTTLAKELSKKLKIPHFEIDSYHFLENWEMRPTEEFISDIKNTTMQDKWILCGDYLNKLEGLTLKRADTVIWLNFPLRIWSWQMIKRNTKRAITREKLWSNNQETLFNFWFRPSKSLLYFSLKLYIKQGRNRQKEKLESFKYSGKVIELKSRKELRIWLKTI